MNVVGVHYTAGNGMPSGTPRPRRIASLLLHDLIGAPGKVVCHTDEVFEPVIEPDGSFCVPQFDSDKFYRVVVREGADFHFAVGRYLDQFHGLVVASFARPASPVDIAACATLPAPLSPGNIAGNSRDAARQENAA